MSKETLLQELHTIGAERIKKMRQLTKLDIKRNQLQLEFDQLDADFLRVGQQLKELNAKESAQ